jgi:radical SAM superfamily enzyme YgiQ (UPF0313 family)
MGLQLLATILNNNGYTDITCLDYNKGDDPGKENYSGKKVLVGMSVTFLTLKNAIELSAQIKKQNPKAIIIFGGAQATVVPEELIAEKCVDAVVIGDGTKTIVEIAKRMTENNEFDGIKGMWFKKNGRIIKNMPREFTQDLDSLPFIDRVFFNDASYQNYKRTFLERIFGIETWHIITSQSCPFNCKMCQPALRKIAGNWRIRSVNNVIKEMQYLIDKYDAKYFDFIDNDFGINKEWLVDFCKKVKRFKGIKMHCNGRANILDAYCIQMMKKAGFDSISYGAESGTDRVLSEIMNKGVTVKQVIDFAENCYKNKIKAGAFWMIGNPGETLDEMKKTCDLAASLPIYYCHFSIAMPVPHTNYYYDALNGGYLNMRSWNDIQNRDKPALLKDGITKEDIYRIDKYLINTMIKNGWFHQDVKASEHLVFINTRRFAKFHPIRLFGMELNKFFHDFKWYHLRNIWLGIINK